MVKIMRSNRTISVCHYYVINLGPSPAGRNFGRMNRTLLQYEGEYYYYIRLYDVPNPRGSVRIENKNN